MYRIPLRYFSDIERINFPTKIDYRIRLFLETDMDKLFKSRKVLASSAVIPKADVEIIFTRGPFIRYEQILPAKNFRQHLETIMVSKKILRMGAQKMPIQKTYEIQKGSDSLSVEFLGSSRQFDWIEISIRNIYSFTNEKKYSTDNLTQKHLLYKQFVSWNCNGSSVAPLTEYMDNPIFQELPDEETYYSLKRDEKVYLDLRATSGYVIETEKLERNDSKINLQITLKAAATFHLRVKIWVYSLSEYLYVVSKSGLTLKHRTYAINQSDEDFLE